MKRKIFSLFLCSMVLTGGLVSCSTDKSTADTSLSSSTVEETTEAATDQVAETEYKTMDPPEEGWTIEELLSVTYLYGEQLSYPITLNSLPNEVKEGDFETTRAGDIAVQLYHGDDVIGFGTYNVDSVDVINSDTPFNVITFYYNSKDDTKNKLMINGKKIGSDYGNMSDCLGELAEDTDNNDNTIFYKTKDDIFRINAVNRENVFTTLSLHNISDAKTNKE